MAEFRELDYGKKRTKRLKGAESGGIDGVTFEAQSSRKPRPWPYPFFDEVRSAGTAEWQLGALYLSALFFLRPPRKHIFSDIL